MDPDLRRVTRGIEWQTQQHSTGAARRPHARADRQDPARLRAADARLLDPPVAERHDQRHLGRPLPRRGRARRDVQRQHGHVPADRLRVRLRHGRDHPHRPGVGAARTSTARAACSARRADLPAGRRSSSPSPVDLLRRAILAPARHAGPRRAARARLSARDLHRDARARSC